MQASASQGRPYRSHLRPACGPCRRRKSRCKIEASSSCCLMCRIHGTECLFPEDSERSSGKSSGRSSISTRSPATSRGEGRKRAARTRVPPISTPVLPTSPSIVDHGVPPAEVPDAGGSVGTSTSSPRTGQGNEAEGDYQLTPLSMDHTEHENTHIVGPANTADSQVLADYLSTITTDNGGMRIVRPVPGSRSKPVLFSTVQKRPMGVERNTNQAREKLNIIEQFLAPYAEQLIEL